MQKKELEMQINLADKEKKKQQNFQKILKEQKDSNKKHAAESL
jgi:hypothetical protein